MRELPLKPPVRGFFDGSWTDEELRLQARLRTLQVRFFPRWKSAAQWRVRINKFLPPSLFGYCRYNFCSIEISPIAVKINSECGIDLTLLHEAAHAVTRCLHRCGWHDRMMRIATELERDGEPDLAFILRADADSHFEPSLGREFAPPPPFQFQF